MPELITKHPEVAMEVLKSANVKCGVGADQKILTRCPKDKFCSLPSGELCIYDVHDISSTTQINTFDLFQNSDVIISIVALSIMVFLLGLFAGTKFGKK